MLFRSPTNGALWIRARVALRLSVAGQSTVLRPAGCCCTALPRYRRITHVDRLHGRSSQSRFPQIPTWQTSRPSLAARKAAMPHPGVAQLPFLGGTAPANASLLVGTDLHSAEVSLHPTTPLAAYQDAEGPHVSTRRCMRTPLVVVVVSWTRK